MFKKYNKLVIATVFIVFLILISSPCPVLAGWESWYSSQGVWQDFYNTLNSAQQAILWSATEAIYYEYGYNWIFEEGEFDYFDFDTMTWSLPFHYYQNPNILYWNILDMNTWVWDTASEPASTPTPSQSPSPSPSPSPTPSPSPSQSPSPPSSSPSPSPSPSSSPSPPAPSGPAPLPQPQTITTTETAQVLNTTDFMDMLFNDPGDKKLKLYVPGYAYFQGVIYSNGNIQAKGPVRIIGGVICQRKDPADLSETPKSITLKDGAMLTTDPDYLDKRLSPPNLRLRITKWEEMPGKMKEANN